LDGCGFQRIFAERLFTIILRRHSKTIPELANLITNMLGPETDFCWFTLVYHP
jgi:hypothetical protein